METLLTTHNFSLTISRVTGAGPQKIGQGSFQEISGLDVEMEVSEVQEGGRNNATWQKAGRVKYQPLVCKRGMFSGQTPAEAQRNDATGDRLDAQIWRWFQDVADGYWPPQRYDGSISVFDQHGSSESATALAVWSFKNAIPAKVVGPQLNAKSGEIAIEELHLVHEGLRLEIPAGSERGP